MLGSAATHPYASPDYAATLAHIGAARWVEEWGAAVLLREVPGDAGARDASGGYPVCALPRGADLAGGLAALRGAGAVSVVLVADPCQGAAPEELARAFPLCRAFKTHYVIDRGAGAPALSKHHRDRVRRAHRHCRVRVAPLRENLDAWCALYADLIAKHGIVGAAAFSRGAFEGLAELAGLTCFLSETADGSILGMQLWLRHGDVAYSHLTATNADGYKLLATYALYAAAIEHFADCRVLDFGGGAGTTDDPENPLAWFKRGFSNASLMAHLCGAVLDDASYRRLAAERDAGEFFPAYRAPRGSAGT